MSSWGQVAEGAGSPGVMLAEDVLWQDQENPYETGEDQENPYDQWEDQNDPYEQWEDQDDPYDHDYPYEAEDYDDTSPAWDQTSPASSYSPGVLGGRLQPPTPTVEPAEIWVLDEAIALLELSMGSDTEQEEGEREQLVVLAVGVLKRQRERRRDVGREREPDNCVVCCAERADTLLMPCRHLVMCGACCDRMGIKERASWGVREVPCPICRTMVEGTIKTFRG